MPLEEIIIGRDRGDVEKYGKDGCVFIGKHLVGTGHESYISNPVLMDLMRPHVVMVVGKRGSGKCLHGDTLITLGDGSVVPIKELGSDCNSILGVDEKYKIRSAEKDGFYEREVDTLLTLKLRSGKEIKLTPEHPLLTIKGWVDAQKLTIGSRIATPRKLDVFGHEAMEDYKIKILAYLIAEGHLSNGFVLFSNSDNELIHEFFDCVEAFDSNLKTETHGKFNWRVVKKYRDKDLTKMRPVRNLDGSFAKGTIPPPQKRTSLLEWLEELGLYGKLSHGKFIPEQILKLPKEQIAVFLNRLFSCDGSLYKHKTSHGYAWEISYSSVSEKLIRQVHHLLLRFGIVSRIRNKSSVLKGKIFNRFEIVIGTANAVNFIREIGFFGKKVEREQSCLDAINSKTSNPNVDTVPKDIWDIYKPENWAEIGRSFGYAHPKALIESKRYSPSRDKLLKFAVADKNDMLRAIALSDIFWDEVVSIEKLEGEFKVYDISVPELHNFVANDIVVHNSYSLGVMAEELFQLPDNLRANLSFVLIDTMGIFWSMKDPNDDGLMLLREWGMKPSGFKIKNLVPAGLKNTYIRKGIPFDGTIAITPNELTAVDWSLAFKIDLNSNIGILLERVLKKLGDENYSLEDIIAEIGKDKRSEEKERIILQNRFISTQGWGIFSTEATPIEGLMESGGATVIDVSQQEWGVRNLMVGIISQKIYDARIAARRAEEIEKISGKTVKKTPMTWILMDEAHNFLPATGETGATRALLKLVKEGRQPGISLVFATQRPNKLHEDVIAQSDLIISHRLTAKPDLDALSAVMQTYLLEDLRKAISNLPRTKGSAVVLDDNSERLFSLQVRPRMSWHAGGSPIAMKE